jgi:hypothetical protein
MNLKSDDLRREASGNDCVGDVCDIVDKPADSDEAGRLFQGEAGHLFRFHSGQCSDLKPDTLLV